MSKQPISFRFSEQEFEILEKNCLPDESPSLCAARILRETLGISKNGEQQLETHTLNSFVSSRVESEIEGLKMWLEDYVNNSVNSIVNRLETLEKPKPKATQSRKVQENSKEP